MRFRQKSDKHFRPPQRENGNPKAAKPTASLAGPGPPCTAPRAAQVTGRLRPRAHGCFDLPAPGAHTPLRPSGRLCGQPATTPHVTCSPGPACTPIPGAPWSFRPASERARPPHVRVSAAGAAGRAFPGPSPTTPAPALPPMATAWRQPTEPRQLLCRRTRPSPWWWWHPAPFSEWQPVWPVESGDAQTQWPTAQIAM